MYSGSGSTAPIRQESVRFGSIITFGASLESELTFATLGKEGARKFNPFSNLDFVSIPISKYIGMHLTFAQKLNNLPKIFAVNYLKDRQQNLAIHFGKQSGRDVDKFQKVPFIFDQTGAPILKDCLAYLDSRVCAELDSGDHTIFLGEVLSGKVLAAGNGLQYQLTDYLNAEACPQGPIG